MNSYWLVILHGCDVVYAVAQTGTNETEAAVSAASELALGIDEAVSFHCVLGPYETKVQAYQEFNFRFDGATEFTVQYEVHLLDAPVDLEQISYSPEVEKLIEGISTLENRIARLEKASAKKLNFYQQQSLDAAIDLLERKVGAIREALHERNRIEVLNG